MRNRRARRATGIRSPGLDELMIVNPACARGGEGVLIGSDGGVYRVRKTRTRGTSWFLGDDGSLYKAGRTRTRNAVPRYFLSDDGALYAVERTTRDGRRDLGCGCGMRTGCPCARHGSAAKHGRQ